MTSVFGFPAAFCQWPPTTLRDTGSVQQRFTNLKDYQFIEVFHGSSDLNALTFIVQSHDAIMGIVYSLVNSCFVTEWRAQLQLR